MYNLKEILVGYKIEYQKIKEKVNDLENNVKILDNSIKKCFPLLVDNKELALYFIDGKRNIMDTIINIREESNELIYDLYNLEWDKTLDLVYHFENSKREYHILIQYIEEFINKVKNILNTEYSKYIKGEFIGVNKEILTINHNILNVENQDKEFIYYPYPDKYEIHSLNKNKENELKYFLFTFFSKKQFNDYQREFIEENKDKELILK